jgi:ribonuclease HI
LAIASNIQPEALALFQGLNILKVLNIREVNDIGDSQAIINTMVTRSETKDLRLARLIHKILDLGDSFHNLSVYHVLRGNNKEEDNEANKAALHTSTALLKGEREIWEPIP